MSFRPPFDYLERERLAADPDAPTATDLLAENAALKREIARLKAAIPDAGLTIGHYPPTSDNLLGIGPFAETLEETIAIIEARR